MLPSWHTLSVSVKCFFIHLNIILNLYITDTFCSGNLQKFGMFHFFVSDGDKNYYPELWGVDISNAILKCVFFLKTLYTNKRHDFVECIYPSFYFTFSEKSLIFNKR